MTFYRGQEVVFIGPDFSQRAAKYGQVVPTPRAIYTVREVEVINSISAIRLIEIKNAPHSWANGFCEMAFEARYFRPVQTKSTETGMAILRGLLDTSPVSEPSHG